MRALLLSDACTTGWAHLGHEELWLTPDSLVRVGLRSLTVSAGIAANFGVLGAAAASSFKKHKVDGRPAEFDPSVWEAYLAVNARTTLVTSLDDVAAAEVRRGVITSRLLMSLKDGTRRKLLWTRNRIALPALAEALAPQLR